QVRKVLKRFKPHAVIGVGGYASFPVLQYAQFAGIPAFIHESNSFAGKANKMLGKKAAKIFVATDGMEQFFPREKLQVTGNPVRPAIKNVKHINKEEALSFFGMKPGKTTLLVVGGSLGARSVNEAIAAGLETILGEGIQLIWQTGKTDAGKWKAGVKDDAVWVNDFINQMELAYAAADMVVSRAGAMAIAELCVVGKPVIFVPYPFAAEDHQTVNALNLVNKHAALMVKDHEVKDKLVAAVIALNANGNLQIELQKNIEPFAVYNADEQVAATVLKKINQ
ncbi:MAG: UDP-N-acetylglucosamine--N-acetylmuramyl-(pentapeptide) pyrophosphoryl-undecaprenol N-acetylglucosamine transferase, partial [Flavisolibacter sp.]|nr:UDP-N-acetylglucosamine--N-acetylmuramyl-(pentapeptide) pyrophosphoryl-undecaprenol N-acetylglucosamine transferase [Flavisolibacter sp.]